MTTQIGIGYSQAIDPTEAGRAAAEQALAALGSAGADFVSLFFTPYAEPDKVIAGARAVLGQTRLIGACSRGGLIVADGIIRSGVAVLALHSDEIRTFTGVAGQLNADPVAAGRTLVQEVWSRADDSLRDYNGLVMALESAHSGNAMVTVVESLGNELGALYPLAGGRAIDNQGLVKPSLFLSEVAYEDAIGAALFLTPGPVGVGVRHGYQPLGRPLVVTRVDGHIVYELDGKTALDAYTEQFPDRPISTPESFAALAIDHPLGLPQMGREYIIRDPYAGRLDGSLLCAGAVARHSVVRIMQGDRQSLLDSARQAAEDAMAALDGKKPLLALIFNCITRLNYMGEAASTELELVRQIIGPETPLLGLVTYGEIAAQLYSPPAFHNKAIVVSLIGAA